MLNLPPVSLSCLLFSAPYFLPLHVAVCNGMLFTTCRLPLASCRLPLAAYRSRKILPPCKGGALVQVSYGCSIHPGCPGRSEVGALFSVAATPLSKFCQNSVKFWYSGIRPSPFIVRLLSLLFCCCGYCGCCCCAHDCVYDSLNVWVDVCASVLHPLFPSL